MYSAVELEIELFCRGIKIDRTCELGADARRIARTRAGLGSGLELVIRGPKRKHWVNVPVAERFAAASPFRLFKQPDGYWILDERSGEEGNYLGIYVSTSCLFWASRPSRACKFCTTGKNVGSVEQARKNVEDVVEVALAAREESGSVFTHLNTGYHYEDVDRLEAIHGLRQCEPFVRALRERVGGFIGVQCMPVPRRKFGEYDALIAAGADHFSFCYEFEDPRFFEAICPGKAETLGQEAFFEAMEYTARKLGRGRVSGEIIAGIEPIDSTKRGIDRIVAAGAFPTVCIFRPTIGSEMEDAPSPDPNAMKEVFAHLYEACRDAGIPVGVLPIEVSLVVQPEECAELAAPRFSSRVYDWKRSALRVLARPYVSWKMRPRRRAA